MNTGIEVEVKKLTEGAQIPAYQTPGAAGFDFHACLDATIVIPSGGRAAIPTGLAFSVPQDLYLRISPRSGTAAKNGIDILAGVVDSDYRGEVKVVLQNHGQEPFTVAHGDRIAQGVITPCYQAIFSEKEALTETARGQGGFGSTGIAAVE